MILVFFFNHWEQKLTKFLDALIHRDCFQYRGSLNKVFKPRQDKTTMKINIKAFPTATLQDELIVIIIVSVPYQLTPNNYVL